MFRLMFLGLLGWAAMRIVEENRAEAVRLPPPRKRRASRAKSQSASHS